MIYNEGDLVLCKVIEVGKTAVSIVLDSDSRIDGTIPVSEIAPGRIRNLRDYVVPNKRIVCKILRVNPGGSLVLSLRRVSIKEMKEVLDNNKREKASFKLLEVVLGNESSLSSLKERLLSEGKKFRDLVDSIKTDRNIASVYLDSSASEKLLKILSDKKEKEKEVKRTIILKSKKPEGLTDIKNILSGCDCDVNYIAGGKYSLTIKASDYKEANNRLSAQLLTIEKRAKDSGAEFESLDK